MCARLLHGSFEARFDDVVYRLRLIEATLSEGGRDASAAPVPSTAATPGYGRSKKSPALGAVCTYIPQRTRAVATRLGGVGGEGDCAAVRRPCRPRKCTGLHKRREFIAVCDGDGTARIAVAPRVANHDRHLPAIRRPGRLKEEYLAVPREKPPREPRINVRAVGAHDVNIEEKIERPPVAYECDLPTVA